jgi:predicted nucleic acid-binding protein
MPIEWKASGEYEDRREEAEERIAARDPDDWPTIALALTLGLPIWSQDKGPHRRRHQGVHDR